MYLKCMAEIQYFKLVWTEVSVFDRQHGEKACSTNQTGQIHDNLSPPRGGAGEVLLPIASCSWTCHARDTILKHFFSKTERSTFFFCLQAVNYLTSTHNEQCKTSQNLIKRQREEPSADGK